MENDNETATEPVAPRHLNAFGRADTCIFCGDPTTEMVCPECDAKNTAANEAKQAQDMNARHRERERAFQDKIGNYADTEMVRLPETAARRAAAEYVIGSGAGLTISGPGDTGKTRSAVWVAMKEVAAGRWAEFRQCGELRQEVVQHAKNGEWGRGIGPLMRCDLLVLDDFGNHEFTRTAEEFFLAMLERRTNTGKRTFVTTQYTAEQLRKLFTTEQMADAVLRRIGKGFATMVNTRENLILPWK